MMYKSLSSWTRPSEELVENPNSNQGLLTLSSSAPSLCVLTSISASVAIYKVFTMTIPKQFSYASGLHLS